MHLTISAFPHPGQLNLVVPWELATFFLHDMHVSFCFDMTLGIEVWFIKVIV